MQGIPFDPRHCLIEPAEDGLAVAMVILKNTGQWAAETVDAFARYGDCKGFHPAEVVKPMSDHFVPRCSEGKAEAVKRVFDAIVDGIKRA